MKHELMLALQISIRLHKNFRKGKKTLLMRKKHAIQAINEEASQWNHELDSRTVQVRDNYCFLILNYRVSYTLQDMKESLNKFFGNLWYHIAILKPFYGKIEMM